MSDCSINDVEFNIVYSEEEKNILKVNSKKEIFFEVFECSVFDNDTIVVEQIGLWKDLPLVSVEFVKEDKKYTCEAVLVEDGTTEFIVNEDNLFYLGIIQKEEKNEESENDESENDESENDVNEDNFFCLNKVQNEEVKTNEFEKEVNEDIKLEINHTYDEKIKEYEDKKFNFLNELELQFEDKITNLKEDIGIKLDAFFEKLEDKKKELIDDEIETITLNLNEKFNSFKNEVNELSDFNRDNIYSILENKITDIDDTVKLFLDNLTENYSSKFKNNDKKVTASLIEINSIRNKLKKYYEKNEEKFNDLFKLEEKLVNQDDYSDKNKEIFEYINEELERINNKFIYISEEENKKYNELLATVSKTDVVEYRTILKEKIQDVELNLVKEELKSELSNNFKNEITSLKRYAEMSAGGGTNAVQYANGGTMNGSLNVNANILSGGRNLDDIFATNGGGSLGEYLPLSGGNLTGPLSSNNNITAVTGNFTNINALTANFTQTIVSTTSALSVVNDGTGPALYVQQSGTEPVAHFIDKDGDDIVISDNGNLGVGTFTPMEKLTVSGNISASGSITGNGILSNGNLDMNGNSIVNVASGSITFEDGASIGSSGTGNLILSGDTTFTGDVNLSRIAGNNEILIRPSSSNDITLEGYLGGSSVAGGDAYVKGGNGNNAGDLILTGGNGLGSDARGGNVNINAGRGNDGGEHGNINIGTSTTNQVNLGSISDVESEINSKAPVANPTFTGDVSIPGKIIHTGDTDTFINFSSNQIDLEAGGTRIVRINGGFTVTADDGNDGDSSGTDGAGIILRAGDGGEADGDDGIGGDGGDITIDAGDGGDANDGDDGNDGDINIGTTNAENIRIGRSGTSYTIGNNSSFRSAIGASPAANPTFTGDVSISDKIIHTGDTNTFINFSDADQIDLEAGGTRIVRINEDFSVTAKTGTTGTDGGNGGNISIQGGLGGEGSDDGGDGGNVTIDAGAGGNGVDDNGQSGNINIGTTNACNINIGNSGSRFTIGSGSSLRTAIGAAPTADPIFTGVVQLERIYNQGSIQIEPDITIFGDAHDVNLVGSLGITVPGVFNGDGGDINIQGGGTSLADPIVEGTGDGAPGNVNIRAGASSIGSGSVNIGITNTDTVNIGASGKTTTINGTLTVDKISLSDNSFIVETGDFTLSDSHKGATILLQNTAAITITIPALSAGHTTTFIAETINDVSFASGTGLSGLNSFNGANSMLGQFAQAQVIFKTNEYAFLGGQIT